MTADAPTILATSGGFRPGTRGRLFEFAALIHHALELSGVSGRTPRLAMVDTAAGDQAHWKGWTDEAARVAGIDLVHLDVFPMPNTDDPEGLLGGCDAVWVGGGSVANLLALWRLHGWDAMFRRLWKAGVVLAGVSAGSVCWHVGGTTDSFGPELRPVTNGLGFLPYGNGVHHDSEAGRRPLVQRLVADGTLPVTHCTDDGVGLVYVGTELVEAVSEQAGKAAWVVTRAADGTAAEERMAPRLLDL